MAMAMNENNKAEFNVTPFSKLAIKAEIGRGGFGRVFHAHHEDWGEVAYKELPVKCINPEDRIAKELMDEVKIHRQLQHTNVVRLIGTVFEPKHYGVLLEYAKHGDAYNFLTNYQVGWAWKLQLAYDIALGVNFLHTQMHRPIIHGDLKVKNILITEAFKAQISDFGLSRWKQYSYEKTGYVSQGATVTHIPPESWKDVNAKRTEKYDVYSFGILFWELMAHPQRPFQGVDSAHIKSSVINNERPDLGLIPRQTPPFMVEIMKDCWNQETTLRPKFSEVQERLHRKLQENKAIVDVAKQKIALKVPSAVPSGPNVVTNKYAPHMEVGDIDREDGRPVGDIDEPMDTGISAPGVNMVIDSVRTSPAFQAADNSQRSEGLSSFPTSSSGQGTSIESMNAGGQAR